MDTALLLDAFPDRAPSPFGHCMHCASPSAEERESRGRFEALLRSHPHDQRARLPISDVLAYSFGHGSALVHEDFRRFAFFVPALLTGWSAGQLEVRQLLSLAQEAWRSGNAGWTEAEAEALRRWFVPLLAGALWARDDPRPALEVTRVALALKVEPEALAEVWAAPDAERALHAVAAQPVVDWNDMSWAICVLTHSRVVSALQQRFFGADGPRATALSEAERSLLWIRQSH